MKSWAKAKQRAHIVITTTYGATIRGLLLEATRDEMILCQARLLTIDKEFKLDGDVVIPRQNVHYWQPIAAPLADDVVHEVSGAMNR